MHTHILDSVLGHVFGEVSYVGTSRNNDHTNESVLGA